MGAILATVPGLDVSELKVELSDDQSILTVRGLRLSSAEEAGQMQNKVSARIRHLGQQSPGQFVAIQSNLGEVAKNAYVELGQDSYGRFAESFRVPVDADVQGIDASYQNGVLRVTLPRKRSLELAPERGTSRPDWATARPGRFAGGHRSYPSGRRGAHRQDAGIRSPALFGGMDDSFFWDR